VRAPGDGGVPGALCCRSGSPPIPAETSRKYSKRSPLTVFFRPQVLMSNFSFLASIAINAGAFFGQPAKCEVAHTSLLIGRASLLFVDWDRICGRFDVPPKHFSPAHARLFCARPGNAKGPVIRDGAFQTFLRWWGMLSHPADFSIRHALIRFQGRTERPIRRSCVSSCLTSAARRGGMGVARASY
jgi:hypothetical protein